MNNASITVTKGPTKGKQDKPNDGENCYFNFDPGRARSYRYPEEMDEGTQIYTDSTYYDSKQNYFDLGYQRLKNIYPQFYPQFNYLKILFIDHNCLTTLPAPESLPNLEELNCSANKLTNVPFYPKLTFLNMSQNTIQSIGPYEQSNLRYLDCSYNKKFVLDLNLPQCIHLYITNCELEYIDLDFVPKLKYLDCGCNNLTYIMGGSNLIEINFCSNNMISLPMWPKLEIMLADDNFIVNLARYPSLKSLNISYNHLKEIADQPSLTKIIATHNSIDTLGNMPLLDMADFSYNNLTSFEVHDKIQYLSVQFNPITNLILTNQVLKSIKELQVNFDTYINIYQSYLSHFESVTIQTNEQKLEQLINSLGNILEPSMSRYIYKRFCTVDFKDRESMLHKIALKIYWKYFSKNKVSNMEELIATNEFQTLLDNITKFYYRTIIITICFNGYF